MFAFAKVRFSGSPFQHEFLFTLATGAGTKARHFAFQDMAAHDKTADAEMVEFSVEQCSKPLLVDDYSGLYYPIYGGL